ncbi:MAG: cation:proton antiporter [Candidatus Micrarchaeota archaeon]
MFELFLILGIAIFFGFLATLIFERTRISQVIILILFGFLLGPMFNVVDVSSGSVIVSLLPFLATLALIVLMFDAGLMIDCFSVARAIPKSVLFTLLVFATTVALVSVFAYIAMGWPLLHGILLGAVLGGTSSAIVIAMVERAKIENETRSLLILESTITDALCIIVAVIAIQVISSDHAIELASVANMLLSSFSIAIIIGSASAVLWIVVIERDSFAKYAYMLTLAMVFGVFAVTEAIDANGGVAVFIFGMVLGNAKELGKLLHLRKEVNVNPNIQLFQEEITFFVRTFFFVYIGMLLSPAYFNLNMLVLSLALLALFIASRWVGQKAVLKKMPEKDQNIALIMLPRGLAAAVLATMPLSSGIEIAGFQQIVFVVILLSNVAATMGIFIFDRETEEKHKPKPSEILEEAIEAADSPPEEAEPGDDEGK